MRFGKQVFSGTLPMLPRFRYANADQILDSKNRLNQLLETGVTDPTPPKMKAEEWLQGAARVRPKLAQWETLRFMTAANAPLDLAPVQVPTDALTLRLPDGSRKPIYTWVATEFTEGVQLQREVVSIVVTGEAAAAKTQALQTGLLLDEWTETIPTDEELTALTFHYNQPNTEAPQTLILAVCSETKWSSAAILNAVTDTLNRAKMRTVTLEHIRKEAVAGAMPFKAAAQMLPMLVAPVNVQQHSFSLDFGVANKNSLNRTTGLADEVPMGHYLIWKENI